MIYFIQQGNNGPIKIGKSNDPKKRLRSLQTASPHELCLLKTLPENFIKESEIHEKFKEYRIEGEWFEPASEVLEYIGIRRTRNIDKLGHLGLLFYDNGAYAEAGIIINSFSEIERYEDKIPCLVHDCITFEELDARIKLLIADLEDVRNQARIKFKRFWKDCIADIKQHKTERFRIRE